jgi:hypothetical protein
VAFIIVIDVPTLLNKGLLRELWTFSILLFIGAVLSIAIILHLPIPNPLDLMIIIYKPIVESLGIQVK